MASACKHIIPGFERPLQEDYEFEAGLSYLVRSCQRKKVANSTLKGFSFCPFTKRIYRKVFFPV